jgi:polysaccharide chain length determinant protein (PEP-CTERM system associated)
VLLEPSASVGDVKENTDLDARISKLQQQLDQLRTRFTEQHPDVQATESILAQLREQREKQRKSSASAIGGKPAYGTGSEADSYVQQLQFALAQAESDVASLRARVGEYQTRYDNLKKAVNDMPEIQAKYQSLTRDYEVTKNNYDKLLATKEKATLSGDLQTKADTVEFRVIDPPFASPRPVAPKRFMLSTAVLLLALGAGVGVAFLLSQLRRTVDSAHELADVTGGRPVLGLISVSETPARLRRRRLAFAAYTVTMATLLATYGVLVTAQFFS